MVVADASSVVDALIGSGARGEWARAALFEHAPVVAPHLVDVEVASGLRRLALLRTVPERRAREALRDFQALSVLRFAMTTLLDRIWELRSTMSAYDASYVALAEAFALPLMTTDQRLARTRGHRAEIIAPPA